MIFHRGREMAHQEVGRAKMTRLLGEIGDHGQIETPPRMEGNVLVALLAPKKSGGGSARASYKPPTYAVEKESGMPRNASKPKRKLKTHRGAAKRFKMTATGKLLRMHSGKRHLLGTKAAKRMRKLKKVTRVSPGDTAKTLQMLPYGL